ncbi:MULTISPECIES: hypothetical protein [unclassified Brevibacterium]|uniref:hypothetical protein n=1 Tax=unclassified Brevibacterium TaxID=2614124 RepID=UPI001E30050C|nr:MULTISPECIES: hypothetical protein [unclassified Brevibacterium]MCD1284451.1 hypothetical protein [Brevibacterium sp. CCUG 69071]MDK8435933.1 hypothetical protein [Brevibacterium sp. H-BE7]
MKKVLIALTSIVCIIGAVVGGLAIWEHRSKISLEAEVEDYLDDVGIDATGIDVHGRPYIIFALQDSVDLTYVDLALQDGTNKDQLLLHRLSNGRPERLTRFVTFDHPSGEVDPIERADGSFTDSAMVDGSKVTFTAKVTDDRLELFADGAEAGTIDVGPGVTAEGAAVTDTSVVVELGYDSPDFGDESRTESRTEKS